MESYYGFSAGWLTGDDDTLAEEICFDAFGRVISAKCAGIAHVAVSLSAGFARSEAFAKTPEIAATFQTQMPVPACRIRGARGWLSILGEQIISVPAASEVVAGEAATLAYASSTRLSYQFVRGLVGVTRVSDGALLAEGVDYSLDRNRGILTGLKNVAAAAVTVDYIGHKARVEIVSADRITGALTLTAGSEVKRWFSEYEPAVPAGQVPVWRGLRTPEGALLLPSYLYQGAMRIDEAGAVAAEVAYNRRLLAPVISRLIRGDDIDIFGYGDSITQVGSAAPYTNADLNLAPNGPRDRINHFEFWDAPTQSHITLEDRGDGRGNTGIREGWNWRLREYLESVYGATVLYRNWGIGGSTSANSVAGSGLMNGLYPDRINAIKADIAATVAAGRIALVTLAFGMNGGVDHYTNTRAIIVALRASGAHVVVMTPVRPNPAFAGVSPDDWRTVCAHIVRAGLDEGCATIDTRRIFEDGNLAGLGVTSVELCGATLNNHPDRKEYVGVSKLLTELL